MKILVHDASGNSQEYIPIVQTLGQVDQKKAVQTGDDGRLHPSLIQSAIGEVGETVFISGQLFAPTVTAGMQVFKSQFDGTWHPAIVGNDILEAKQGLAFDLAEGVVVIYGIFHSLAHGLDVTATYYLSDVTPGAVQTAQPNVGFVQACIEVLDKDTLKIIDQAVSNWSVEPGTFVTMWTDLLDTPPAYTGHANKSPQVNLSETALEMVAKADLNGNDTELFKVANATAPTEAVNLRQVDGLVGGLNYQGLWTPNAISFPDETLTPAEQGYFWICDSDGTDKDGTVWTAADWIIFNGSNAAVLGVSWDLYSPLINSTFIGSVDTPGSYAGEAGNIPVVNPGETGLIFQPQEFTTLIDTPINYVGSAGKAPLVNPTETGLEFAFAASEGYQQDVVLVANDWIEVAKIPKFTVGTLWLSTDASGEAPSIKIDFAHAYGIGSLKAAVTNNQNNTIDSVRMQGGDGDTWGLWIRRSIVSNAAAETWKVLFSYSNSDNQSITWNTPLLPQQAAPPGALQAQCDINAQIGTWHSNRIFGSAAWDPTEDNEYVHKGWVDSEIVRITPAPTNPASGFATVAGVAITPGQHVTITTLTTNSGYTIQVSTRIDGNSGMQTTAIIGSYRSFGGLGYGELATQGQKIGGTKIWDLVRVHHDAGNYRFSLRSLITGTVSMGSYVLNLTEGKPQVASELGLLTGQGVNYGTLAL